MFFIKLVWGGGGGGIFFLWFIKIVMTSFTLNLISVKVSIHDIFKKTLNITPVNITSFTVSPSKIIWELILWGASSMGGLALYLCSFSSRHGDNSVCNN